MKRQRVYTEHLRSSAAASTQSSPCSRALVRDCQLERLHLVLSDAVALELVGAPERVREKYAELLTFHPEVLTTSQEAFELAALYQERGILTPK